MSQKGFVPLILLPVILLAIAATYLISAYTRSIINAPTTEQVATASATPSTETANWKTYTDDKNGFSFKYPKEWNYDAVYFDGGGAGVGFYNEDIKNDRQLTINILSNENFDDLGKRINLSIPEILIDNHRALKYETGFYVQLNPSEVLSIYRSRYPDENKYLDTIPSTFKFTN